MPPTLSSLYPHFLADLEASRQVRPATLRAYRYELAAASRAAQFQCPLERIETVALQEWLFRHPAAASTVKRRAATFNRFFVWAAEHAHCPRNPMPPSVKPLHVKRLPRPIRHALDRDQLDAAIAQSPQPYRLLLILLRETGMRVGEAIALQVGDVVLDAGREALRVREPKNGVERTVILGPTATPKALRGLRSLVKSRPTSQPYEPLFPSPRGGWLSYDAVHYQWHRVCQRANLLDETGKPRYSLHQLRHTHATDLLTQGHPLEIVQRVLGHRDIRSTLTYAELDDTQIRAALEHPKR
jgi:site-specific recombinase XerD